MQVAAMEVALVLALAFAVRAPFWEISVIDWDESVFILQAREMLWGHLPYTTLRDIKRPGSATLIAGAMLLFGERVLAARILAFACVAATALLLRLIVREIGGSRAAGLLAAILYVAFSARLGGLVAHTEVLLAPFSAAGVLLLLRAARKEPGPPRIPVFLAAGLLFGLAVWIKYVPAAPAGLLAGAVLLGTLWRRRAGLSGAVAAGLAFAAGVAAPTLATLLLYWTSGLLDAFLYYNFGFASRYVAAGPGLHMIFRRLEVAWLELWPLLLGAAFLGLALLRRRAGLIPSGSALLLLAWLAGEAIAVAAPRQFFNHYFLLLVPPLSVLSGLALAAGARRIAAPGKEAQAAVLAGGFLALVPGAPHVLATVSVLLTRVDHPRVLAARMLPEIQAGETIYVADWHPILYLPTGTRLPTPVVLGEHLVGSQRFLARIPPDEELARILAANPRFIVMGAVPDNFDPGARAAIEAAVAARYRLHTELELPDGWVRIRAYARLD